MPTPTALILRSPGTNCDLETAYVFEKAGAFTERLHINRLREAPSLLQKFQILVLPGGFSYGDDVGAGKILANQLSNFIGDELRKFRDHEKLILGVCNGFQTLLKSGLIIPPDEDGPVATLTNNKQGRYEDRWVHMKATPGKCPFVKGLDRLFIPMAHGEGRFICREDWILQGLEQTGQVVLKYTRPDGAPANEEFPHNPNGAAHDIAGVCDASGLVMGLMPHPERHAFPTQNPHWTRNGLKEEGDGFAIFKNAVDFFKT